MRRISFKNSIWRAGDSADSGSSKMKIPDAAALLEEAIKPSRAMGEKVGRGAANESRYLATEKKLSAGKTSHCYLRSQLVEAPSRASAIFSIAWE